MTSPDAGRDQNDPVAVRAVAHIRNGEVEKLEALLAEHPRLAASHLRDTTCRESPQMTRSMLHVATDWPGHYPRVAETIVTLVAAGADPNARGNGRHGETALHWAASSDDTAAIDALLAAGADIEARGAVIANGTAMADAAMAQQRGAEAAADLAGQFSVDMRVAQPVD